MADEAGIKKNKKPLFTCSFFLPPPKMWRQKTTKSKKKKKIGLGKAKNTDDSVVKFFFLRPCFNYILLNIEKETLE